MTRGVDFIFYNRLLSKLPEQLELEIDERLHLGCHKLIDNDHSHNHYQAHRWQGQAGKGVAIATLSLLRNPVDNHSKHKEQEHIVISPNHVKDVDVP